MSNEALSPPQDVLLGLGVKMIPSRQQIIGCVGCQWLGRESLGESPRVHAYNIIQCTGFSPQTVYRFLASLERLGVVEQVIEDMETFQGGRAPRKYYIPVNSDSGEAFKSTLKVPDACPFKNEK